MKHFMIKYEFKNGTTEAWHQEIGRFIKAIDNDPELKGRLSYRVLRTATTATISISPASLMRPRRRRCSRAISSRPIRR
jgi:hypothetical protein